MNKKIFKLSTLAFTVAAILNTPAFAAFVNSIDGFTNNGDGTVTDTKTGLVWQACAVGQTFNKSTGSCDGAAEKYNYDEALKITSDFAGKADWRVPTLAELNSIVDLKRNNPVVNKSLFPNPPADNFWSSLLFVGNNYDAWVVNFQNGSSSSQGKSYNQNYIRLVRGDSVFTPLSLNDFIDNEDGTVTHTKTGLTWQRCAVGQTWNGGSCDGKASELAADKAMKLTSDFAGKTDWRLPSYKELLTIVDYSTKAPAANLIVFPETPSAGFWTSTPYAHSSYNGYFWDVNFENGESGYTSYSSYAARLVRGTMSFNGSGATAETKPATGSVDLSATLSANPSPAQKGGDLTYTANISNKGKAAATNATVTFYVAPNFMSFKNASAGCESTPLSVVCKIGDLAAGGSTTKTMTVNLKKSGGISASVLVKSNENDANPADNVGKVATGVKK